VQISGGALISGLFSASLLSGVICVANSAIAASTESYNWKNVRIHGGGFILGIVFNQKEQNLIYARTDIGGAYRWNATTASWVSMLDWVYHQCARLAAAI
jgi:xyloglucan-specific exo-beta-1,4-glucanase